MGATKKGTRALYAPLRLKVDYDPKYPRVVPESDDETIIERYGVELRAIAALDDEDSPFSISKLKSFSLMELFEVRGTMTLTDQRLIGAGTLGKSMLGAIDFRAGTELNFALDLAEIFRVVIMRTPGRRGRLDNRAIRLDIPNHSGGMRIRVIGRLSKGPSKAPVDDVASAIVTAACTERLTIHLDAAERVRVEEVRAGEWNEEGQDLVANIRHPDDIPEIVTAGLGEASAPPPEPPAGQTGE